ncbi:MAG TPA: hypothetical protein VKG84_03005, partial [Candidatus Acidoferrales bacterium]|nr:hypothetical protein [Candidatus Acidoferrales bacterium]
SYLLFDVGGAIAMAGMLLMALAAVARHTAMLYRSEPLPLVLHFPQEITEAMNRVCAEAGVKEYAFASSAAPRTLERSES